MGTITKALDLLGHFSRGQPEIGLTTFVRLSGRDKATVHRYLTELVANGFLEQNLETRAYRLGPAILRLSLVREATHPLRGLLRPIIRALADEVGELAHATILQGERLSTVYHYDPALHGTQVHYNEAEMLPLHATASGLAVLAFAPRSLRDAVFRAPLEAFTPYTVTDRRSLETAIAAARGGICRVDRAFDLEVTGQAAPIFGASGGVLGAIAVAVPEARATAAGMAHARAALCDAARAATASLGGDYPALDTPREAEVAP
ncbi:MAG: IclR family transcriptional regulator [Pseudomonadota bacterium]